MVTITASYILVFLATFDIIIIITFELLTCGLLGTSGLNG